MVISSHIKHLANERLEKLLNNVVDGTREKEEGRDSWTHSVNWLLKACNALDEHDGRTNV